MMSDVFSVLLTPFSPPPYPQQTPNRQIRFWPVSAHNIWQDAAKYNKFVNFVKAPTNDRDNNPTDFEIKNLLHKSISLFNGVAI